MYKRLIIYSTTDGQTKLICERIKQLSKYKNEIKIISIDQTNNEDLSFYDIIIIGASIRYGKHNSKVLDFVKNNKEILVKKKSAFFQLTWLLEKKRKTYQKQIRI